MGLTQIPVLPSDYPLFDWADWPDSRAALVKGGETRKFQRQCWNAMVDLFTGAMEEAELPMPEGISLELLRIPEDPLYGPMTAARMNGMLKTIESCIYLWRQWRWDYDNTIRGFLNRRYFRASYNSNIVNIDPDIVYPEYFLELAQTMNLVLELMRGTWPTVKTGAEVITGIPSIYAGGISNHALLAEVNMNITGARVSEAPVILCKPVLLHDASWDLKTLISPGVTSHKAALGERWLSIQPGIYAEGRSTPALLIHRSGILIPAAVQASGFSALGLLAAKDMQIGSNSYAEGLAGRAVYADHEISIASRLFSEGFSGLALLANKPNMKINTRIYAKGIAGFGRASRIWQKSASAIRAVGLSNPMLSVEGIVPGMTGIQADSVAGLAQYGQADALMGSLTKAAGISMPSPNGTGDVLSLSEVGAEAILGPAQYGQRSILIGMAVAAAGVARRAPLVMGSVKIPVLTSASGLMGRGRLMDIPRNLKSSIEAEGTSAVGGIIARDITIGSKSQAKALAHPLLPMDDSHQSRTEITAPGVTGLALYGQGTVEFQTLRYAQGFSGKALTISRKTNLVYSQVDASGTMGVGCPGQADAAAATDSTAQAITGRVLSTSADSLSDVKLRASGISNLTLRTSADVESTAEADADAISHPALLTEAKAGTVLSADVRPEQLPYQELPAKGCARSGATVLILNQEGLTFQTRHCSAASARGALDTAWYPPERVGDGLWIRQIYRTKKRPDGSLDLSGTWDPVSGRVRSVSAVSAGLVSGWLPPVRHEGGLHIRQVRRLEVMEDGSLNLAPYDPAMTAKTGSATAASCTLDTAWYPPVMVDGGLYLRQSQAADINENGELEVG